MIHYQSTTADARLGRIPRRRGLSLIEMMIALAISATLLTSAITALDVMFKGYKQTTESASTHVVSRIVMTRLLGMLRTGVDFGPAPTDVLSAAQNPMGADYFQFISKVDADGLPLEMARIDFRYPGQAPLLRSWGVGAVGPGGPPVDPDNPPPVGPGELWFVRMDPTVNPPTIIEEHPLLTSVRAAVFTLHFDIGPRLVRGTIDLTVEPNDARDLTIAADSVAQTIRLVASAAPRANEEP